MKWNENHKYINKIGKSSSIEINGKQSLKKYYYWMCSIWMNNNRVVSMKFNDIDLFDSNRFLPAHF